jgi:hypothetical protein
LGFQLPDYFTSLTNAIKFSGIIITAPSGAKILVQDTNRTLGVRISMDFSDRFGLAKPSLLHMLVQLHEFSGNSYNGHANLI